jgi:hypothetical protein
MASFNELTTPIDRVSKLLFREYADLLVELAFPGQAVRVLNIEENIEINLPTRPLDMVMTIASGVDGQQLGLHIEYYAHHTADLPQRLFIYSAELTDRMKMPVATVVIYSERRQAKSRPAPEYLVKVGEQVVNLFTYRDIWLVDYADKIRSGELAPLAPFLVEFVARPTLETVQLAKALAHSEANEERRGLLLSLVVLLAARYFDRKTLRRLFQQEEKMLRTNTFIDEWIEEAEKKGQQAGEQKGRQEGEYHLLMRLLNHRFESVSDIMAALLKTLSADQLSELFNMALEAQTYTVFEENVKTMLKIPLNPSKSSA